MGKHFIKKISMLPLKGEAESETKYWSSDYWGLIRGGINYRWYSQTPEGFNLKSPDLKEALKMSQEELKTLSPSEKFDLFRGKYDYPLKNKVSKIASPRRKEWEGICHGWAMAALNHSEPVPRTVTNPDGLQIPFGSSDIKALLSYYYAYKYDPDTTHQMGRRCYGKNYCTKEDMNAGAFHIVIANRVGLEKNSFIADIENKHEVWNQVVKDYDSEILEADLPPSFDSAKGTKKVVRIRNKVRVVFNIVKNSWMPALGTPNQTYKELLYEYDLDLDRNDNIIGGKWRSKVRPDFLWMVKKTSEFNGDFSSLKRLIRDQARLT